MRKTAVFHLGLMVFWILLSIPALTVWKDSLVLVIIMSLYANIEASATAYLTSKKKSTKED